MILEGSTISSTGHARQMAMHLFKDENEVIRVRESLSGGHDRKHFENDLVDMQLYSRMTKGKEAIFHVAISPREYEALTPEQRERAVQMIEEEFGLKGQARMQIDHIKNGRAHTHVFWSKVDQEQCKLIQLSHFKRRLQSQAEQMDKEFGHDRTARRRSDQTYEVTNADRMVERRTGRKALDQKKEITGIWNKTKTGQAFLSALHEAGYQVAKGERARIVVMDRQGNVSNLARNLPKTIKIKHVRERFGELEQSLPDVEQVRESIKARSLEGQQRGGDLREQFHAGQKQGRTDEKKRGVSVDVALDRTLDHHFERKSAVSEKYLINKTLDMGRGRFGPDQVETALKSRRNIIVAEKGGVRYLTTRETVWEEDKMITYASSTKGTREALNQDYQIKRDFLNEGQRGAVYHALHSRDQVVMISGGAGTGKTSLMQEVKEGIEEKGKKLLAFAPSADASRGVLRDKGFEGADTIAALLQSKELQKQTSGNVILIDEAGMVGNKTMNGIFDIAKENNARVILSGDWKQHNSPEAGDALRLLEQESKLPVARVTEIVRQENEPYKEAIQTLAEGNTREGFDKLDQMGSIIEIVNNDERHDRIAKDYVDCIQKGRSAIVVSPTHAEGREITNAIRTRLKAEGELDQDDRQFTSQVNLSYTNAQKMETDNYRPGVSVQFHQNAPGFKAGCKYDVVGRRDDGAVMVQQPGRDEVKALSLTNFRRYQVFRKEEIGVATGDLIRVTNNGKLKEGTRVNNGQVYEVAGFDDNGNIQLSNGKTLDKDYRNFTLGYYKTSHASQGRDAQDVLIAQSSISFPASNEKQFYVSVSRGKERCLVYTDDKLELRDAVSRSGDRMSAREVLERTPQVIFNKFSGGQDAQNKPGIEKEEVQGNTPKRRRVAVSWKDVKSKLQKEFEAKGQDKEEDKDFEENHSSDQELDQDREVYPPSRRDGFDLDR